MAQSAIYLDHNASAPLLPEARDARCGCAGSDGNPSSVHAPRPGAARADRNARAHGCRSWRAPSATRWCSPARRPRRITQAIVGGAKSVRGRRDRCRRRRARRGAARRPRRRGCRSCKLPLLRPARSIWRRWTSSCSALTRRAQAGCWSRCTGSTTRPAWSSRSARSRRWSARRRITVRRCGAGFRQAAPRILPARAADMMAISGPQDRRAGRYRRAAGEGALRPVRLIPGGGQERAGAAAPRRAALIAGFGAAARGVSGRLCCVRDVADLRGASEAELTAFGAGRGDFRRRCRTARQCQPISPCRASRRPSAMMALDLMGMPVSSGSACSSGKVGTSHVLAAMGVPTTLAECALRVSLGWTRHEADIEAFLAAFDEDRWRASAPDTGRPPEGAAGLGVNEMADHAADSLGTAFPTLKEEIDHETVERSWRSTSTSTNTASRR